jgi:serine protease AprX
MVFPPFRRSLLHSTLAGLICLILAGGAGGIGAGGYVTETSGIRWNDVGGIRWNDVGGIRWNDVGGIRWNDVGGIRWNDVGGTLFTDASGVRWNDVGGIRWNDVGGISFDDAIATGLTSVDLELLDTLSFLPDTSSINVIVTYRTYPTALDLAALNALGILGGTRFRQLPMVVVDATPDQIRAIAVLTRVRSVWADRTLSFFDQGSRIRIGMDEVESDPDLAIAGVAPTGAGVTIAILDTGVDGTHPDLPYGTKLVQNVRVNAALNTGPGFLYPVPVEGIPNTDLVLGHGTSVASVAAGSGAASAGAHRGVASGASILALSAGDLFITNVLEGFDYLLDNRIRFGVRVVNCSWGTQGFFDPDDPVNLATRALYDAGVTVVFAAGNYGPSPDTLNPYAVAPWVIGVGSLNPAGRLSDFSSRGIFEELIYHPVLAAPGETITAAAPAALNGGAPYATVSGTSFAAPHVAGVAALLLQGNPTLTPGDIKRFLQQSAVPILEKTRSEVGAGSLDAWAALAVARYPGRPFGTHYAGWLDARPYRIVHRPAAVGAATLAAGSILTIPLSLPEPVVAYDLTLAWGTLPGGNDLDLRVVDGAGTELAAARSLNALSLFGRTEGAQLLGAVPATLTAEINFKPGTGLLSQAFEMRQERAVAEITAYADTAGLAPADRDRVTRAVSRHVMIGRGSLFEAGAWITREELARALALTGGLPQRIPSSPSFPDSDLADAAYPYVETVAGARSRHILMEPLNGHTFKPHDAVTRLDFAVALVRAAGMEAQADARAGESLGVVDEGQVPLERRGYVALARERRLIDVRSGSGGLYFEPVAPLSRLDAAGFLMNLLDLRGGSQVTSLPPPPASAPVTPRTPSPPTSRRSKAR